MDSFPSYEKEATASTWGRLSCSGGLQLCSAERVRQSFFNPVFPGRTIPWPNSRAASRDDSDDDVRFEPGSNTRENSHNSESWVYEEFQFSRTCPTASSSFSKSVEFNM